MKAIILIIGFAVVLSAMNYSNWKMSGKPEKSVAIEKIEEYNPIINVQKTVLNEADKMQSKILEQQEKARIDAFNAQKVKVYIRAKDTKNCMRLLKINTINNEVVECNKDHYVEVRNDELENFKKEQGL